MDKHIELKATPGGGIPPRVKVSQYDKGWPVYVTLHNDNAPWNIPAGATVYVEGRKPDNKGFQYMCERSGNQVTVILTDQMTVLEGDIRCEISVWQDSNTRIGTANFILEVEPAPLNQDVIISDTDIPLIQRVIALILVIDEAVQAAKDSEINAKVSELAAKTSETNAKASELAAKTSETNAKASELAAKTSETNTKASELAAKTSETNAKASELAAKTSETNAKASELAAKTSETNAKASELVAKTSETNAKASELAAKTSETNAKASELAAKTSETNAKASEDNASDSEQNAATYESLALSYLDEIRLYIDQFIPEFYLDANSGILYMRAVPEGTQAFFVDEGSGCLYVSIS